MMRWQQETGGTQVRVRDKGDDRGKRSKKIKPGVVASIHLYPSIYIDIRPIDSSLASLGASRGCFQRGSSAAI